MLKLPAKFEFKATNEAEATSKLLAILRTYQNTWRYKLPDIGNTTKPVDIFGNVSWTFVACELKYLNEVPKDLVAGIHKKLELHQIATLVQTKQLGWLSIIWWYIKPFNSLYLFEWWTQTLPNWSER